MIYVCFATTVTRTLDGNEAHDERDANPTIVPYFVVKDVTENQNFNGTLPKMMKQ